MRCVEGLFAGLALALLAANAGAAGTACSATTGAGTNVLVELFTSEGCSSCPPADRWLSALGRRAGGTAGVVPIAWHVDYWDYIGWKDRFAQAAFSERQRRLARVRRDRFVYTPQVLVQGADARAWARGNFDTLARRVQARPARARISLSVLGRSGSGVDVEARAELIDAAARPAPDEYVLVLAATASGFSTQVRTGENAGRMLEHDHVAFGSHGPVAFGRDGTLALRERLALPSSHGGSAAVVAFVQSARTAEVLQALSLPVCPE
ncbi:MAG: DUF1223 domain-containing protein [Burkholderiales bacterium]|nr:DUF1223 domain-containing protein [Burkholderiales bacterium]